MATRLLVASTALAVLVGVGATPTWGQDGNTAAWEPARLSDGQPDIQGMWDNIDALSTPIELPDCRRSPGRGQRRRHDAPPYHVRRVSVRMGPTGSIRIGTRQGSRPPRLGSSSRSTGKSLTTRRRRKR